MSAGIPLDPGVDLLPGAGVGKVGGEGTGLIGAGAAAQKSVLHLRPLVQPEAVGNGKRGPPFQRGVLREQRGAVGVERFQAPVPGQYRFELRQRPARRAVGGHGQAQRRAQGRDEGVLARRAGLPQQLQPKVAQGRIQRRVAAGRNLRGRPAGWSAVTPAEQALNSRAIVSARDNSVRFIGFPPNRICFLDALWGKMFLRLKYFLILFPPWA